MGEKAPGTWTAREGKTRTKKTNALVLRGKKVRGVRESRK